MAISNTQYEAAFVKAYPQYKGYTAKGTASLFKSEGFLDCILSDVAKLNEVYNALNRITLNVINIAQVVDTFDIGDFGESFTSEYAAGVQRMAIFPMKPVSPKFRNLPKAGVNQQAVRIPKIEDRYFKVNFDFQNFYTLQEFQIKQMFISEYGISEFYAGFMAQMTNSYIEQKHLNTLECINALINSTAHPLQDTQKITLTSFTRTAGVMTPTDGELLDFIQRVKKVVADMRATTSTSAYNAAKFKTHQDISRLRLLCRVGLKDLIETQLMVGAYNPDKLSLPFDIIEVENFGGLYPAVNGTQVYPVYADASNSDKSIAEGEVIGYADAADATVVQYTESEVDWVDPNINTLAVLADKGLVFEIVHNAPRMIAAPYNAAGLYVTNWFSVPGNELHGDALYTMVTFNSPT